MSQSNIPPVDSEKSINSQKNEEALVAQTVTDLEADIPDGGLQAWLSVLGGLVALLLCFHDVN